jgi:cephalosporin-C deacetylase
MTQHTDETLPTIELAENEPASEAIPEPVAATPADDTVFGKPDDFDAFWDEIDADLVAIPANPEETETPLYSTEFATTYNVKITSVGPYRISAFVSIPHGEGPFPALFLAPGYASVVTPPPYQDRQRYVVMSLRYRGTRGSDWPYAGKFPGMLTDGIADPHSWIMRGVIADALRGFEYLLSRPEVDPARVAINGADSGLFVAARRPLAKAIAVGAGFWYRMQEASAATEAYPLEEINDYVRTYSRERDAVMRTLSYFEPLHHASRVTARVLLANDNPEWFAPLAASLGSTQEHYPMTHEGQLDRDTVENWLADQLGAEHLPRIWVPEEIGEWSS